MTVLMTVVAITLMVSAMCSLLEATLYSTRVVTLEAAKAEGRNRNAADRMLRLKRDIATPTAAILILNTIANTAGATFAGMYAADVLGAGRVPFFSATLTLAILLFSEIVPKTFGAARWNMLWPFITWPLVGLVRALTPLVWLTRGLSSLVTGTATSPTVTEDEIRASIRLGAKAGELSASEIQMLESVFHFDETTCGQIMVPRGEIQYFDLDAPAKTITEVWQRARHSRYPVCRGALDAVQGIVHVKDLVGVALTDKLQIASLMRPIAQVPESLSISRLLREMQATHRQLALVVDEYGSTVGLVTLKDVLEEIVGTMRDEHERPIAEIERSEDGYLVRGTVPLAKINRELELDLYDPTVVTLSGLLVRQLGRFPKVGDKVELENCVAEVREVAGTRASLVYVVTTRPPEVQAAP